MKKGIITITLFFLASYITTLSLHAQNDTEPIARDTVIPNIFITDTLSQSEKIQLEKEVEIKYVDNFTPDPSKAALYAVIFPGLGQIYNRKYWKLPIVYGGFLGVAYAITWNGNMHNDYKNAFKDLMTDPRNRTGWHQFVADPSKVLNSQTELNRTRDFLKRRRDYFRRNRDLAIIVGVGLHALCIIDAYVDAHLYHFDVSPDLSMRMMPVVWGPSDISSSVSFGIQCNIVF